MKQLLFIAFCFFCFSTYAQQTYLLKGGVAKIKDGSIVYLENTETGKIDSAVVSNHSFHFDGTVKGTNIGRLWQSEDGAYKKLPQDYLLSVALEKGAIQLKSEKGLLQAIVSGTKTNDEYKAFYKKNEGLYNKIKSIGAEFSKPEYRGDYVRQSEIRERYDAAQSLLKQEQVKYAIANPSSYLGVDFLQRQIHLMQQSQGYAAAYKGLSKNLKATALGKEVGTFLESKNLKVGKMAPDVIIKDDKENPVSIAQENKGYYLLLDFWASWCIPCRAENPNVLAQYEKYKDKNFKVISISMDEEKEHWQKAVREDKLPWKQLSSVQGFNCPEALLYGIKSLPRSFLIDPSGKIIAMDVKGPVLGKKLKEIFN